MFVIVENEWNKIFENEKSDSQIFWLSHVKYIKHLSLDFDYFFKIKIKLDFELLLLAKDFTIDYSMSCNTKHSKIL